ncbi:MAG: sigma-70 family RNA polymerase sigma factor [Candidatus Omnitrophota bacterium]
MQDISEDVIMRAKRGDTDAFEEILRTYGDLVYNVSLRVLRLREDAQEVSQEVFLTIHKKLRDFQGRSSLKTWIYRITINAAINYSKRTGKTKGRTVEYDETYDALVRDVAIRELEEGEYAHNVVNRLLGMLSTEQRVCMVLRNIEGLTYEQIAQTLGVDINAVRSRLKRARDKVLALKKEVMLHEL